MLVQRNALWRRAGNISTTGRTQWSNADAPRVPIACPLKASFAHYFATSANDSGETRCVVIRQPPSRDESTRAGSGRASEQVTCSYRATTQQQVQRMMPTQIPGDREMSTRAELTANPSCTIILHRYESGPPPLTHDILSVLADPTSAQFEISLHSLPRHRLPIAAVSITI